MTAPDWTRQSDAPTLDTFFWCMINKQGILNERKIINKLFNKKTQNE